MGTNLRMQDMQGMAPPKHTDSSAVQTKRREILTVLLVVCTLLFMVLPAYPGQSTHQQTGNRPSQVLLSGMVTGKSDRGIRINGQRFKLDPEVTISDDEGHPVGWDEFGAGTRVKFRVKRGKVDRLIVLLPK